MRWCSEHGYCTVVVSEGCHHPDGTFLAEQGTRDAFGHAQLGGAAPVVANMVKEALGYKFHWAVADYLQRAARHIASKTDVQQAYELGQKAVELALDGQNAVMPTVERISDAPYAYRIGIAALADVANVEKFMPRDFITEDGFGITDTLQALPEAADPGRGPPDLCRRPAGVRDAAERAGAEEAGAVRAEVARAAVAFIDRHAGSTRRSVRSEDALECAKIAASPTADRHRSTPV